MVEILVVVLVIALFSAILVADFPRIKKRMALSRAVYAVSQDIKKVQDMGFSGVKIEGVPVAGYGIYFNLDTLGDKKYIIYADRGTGTVGDKRFSGVYVDCDDPEAQADQDCIIEEIDMSSEPGIIIKEFKSVSDLRQLSVNFSPPNPEIIISTLAEGKNNAEIVLGMESGEDSRSVQINLSGLIEVK